MSVQPRDPSHYLRLLKRDSGGINMPSLLPFLGRTELEVLSVVGSAILIGTHLTTITSVKERILLASRYVLLIYPYLGSDELLAFPTAFSKDRKTFRQEIRDIWVNARNLPPVIRRIVRPVSYLPMNAH